MEVQELKNKIAIYTSRIKKRWYMHLILALVVTAILLKIAIGTKAVYTVQATFLPAQSAESALSPISMILGSAGADGGGTDYFIPLMQSKTISEQVAEDSIQWQGKKRLLADVILENEPPPGFMADLTAKFVRWVIKTLSPPPPGAGESNPRQNVIDGAYVLRLKTTIEASAEVETQGLIFLKYKDTNPSLSKIIVYRYIEVITSYYKKQKTEKSRINYEFYVHRTDSVKAVIDANLRKGAKIEDEEKFKIFVQDAIPTRQIEGQTELLKQIYGELITMREAALNDLMKETPVVQVLDKPEPPFDVSRPNYILNIVGGLILGFLLSVIISIWKPLKADITSFLLSTILDA